MDSATIAKNIADYDSKRVTSTDALNEALNQFGVPEIRKTVSGLRSTIANTSAALNNVDPSVTGRTSQSLVTEAQRAKMVNNERAPIAQNLSDQSGALGTAQGDLTDANGQATTIATNKVNDYNAGRSALQTQYDSTYKREQDDKAARAAAEAQRIAQEQWQKTFDTNRAESDRNFQLALKQSQASAAGKTSAPSTQQVKATVAGAIVGQMSKLRGRDGFVSNETWANALGDWVGSGYSTREFFQNFAQYVNPKYKTSYAGWGQR